jgi:hypothetical protein
VNSKAAVVVACDGHGNKKHFENTNIATRSVRHVSPKRRQISTTLHCDPFQKIIIFIATDASTESRETEAMGKVSAMKTYGGVEA